MCIIHVLLISLGLVQADWKHLATIDPTDGGTNFGFVSSYWYNGSLGNSSSGDYISDPVRHDPIQHIKITSENSEGEKAWKAWELTSTYSGKSFDQLMRVVYDSAIS